ncbi:MAG: MoaD/ThiS family protein [Pseudomonadales bacterium]|nr:MoaD/ThiS family protein [Pseudomonadales bacterium]
MNQVGYTIKVLLFASLREKLGESELYLDIAEGDRDGLRITDVIRLLAVSRGAVWDDTLTNSKVLMAINHTMVDAQHSVSADDELAFYPPVTGG